MCLGTAPRSERAAMFAAAAQLASVLQSHGINCSPQQLITLLKSDWATVAKYAHMIHDGERRKGDRRA